MTRSSATVGGPRDAMSLSAATTFTTSQEQIKIMELEAVAPPGFRNRRGAVRYGSIGDLEYEVPQSRLYCLYINVALCSTALQCICRVIRRRSMTMKAHTYYIIFGRPPIGGEASPTGGATDRGLQRIITCAFSHDTLDRRRCNLTVDEFVDHKNTPRSCCGEIF